MNQKIKVLVVGYGHVGKQVVTTVRTAPDMELVGVVRRSKNDPQSQVLTAHGIAVYGEDEALPKADVAILAVPTRSVPDTPSVISLKAFAPWIASTSTPR